MNGFHQDRQKNRLGTGNYSESSDCGLTPSWQVIGILLDKNSVQMIGNQGNTGPSNLGRAPVVGPIPIYGISLFVQSGGI